MYKYVLLLLLLPSVCFAAPPSSDDCGPYKDLTEVAQQRYGEKLYLTAYDEEYDVQVQLWMNPATYAFHILVIHEGTACNISSGQKVILENKWGTNG